MAKRPYQISKIENLFWLPRIQNNYAEAYYSLMLKFGNRVRINLPFKGFYFFHPNDVQKILQSKPDEIYKSNLYEPYKSVLGEGIVTAEGSEWKKQKKQIGPKFHPKHLSGYIGVFDEIARQQLEVWRKQDDIDISFASLAMTLEALGASLMGRDFNDILAKMSRGIEGCLVYANTHITNPLYPPGWVPTPINKEYKIAKRLLDEGISQIIADCEAGKMQGTLIEEIIQSEQNGEFATGYAFYQLCTLLFAGHDTTAVALSWAVANLTDEMQAAIASEAEQLDHLEGPIGTQDVRKLRYTNAVFMETLRLFPPVPAIAKRIHNGFQPFSDTEIFPEESIFIVPYVTHRHPDFWQDPLVFNPERFLQKSVDMSAFIPFSGGQRGCLGENFALIEGTLFLARMCQYFKISKLSDVPPSAPAATLKMKQHLRAKITPRK